MNLSKLQEIVKDRKAYVLQSMGLKRVRHDLATEQQQQNHGLIFPVTKPHPEAIQELFKYCLIRIKGVSIT